MKDINDSAVGSYKSTSNIKPIEFSDTQILNWAETILEKRFIRSNYLTSPDMTRDFLRVALSKFEREVFLVILLDNQHGVLETEILFQGTIDGAAVYPREVVNATRTGRRLSKPEITKLLSASNKLKYPSMKSRDLAIILVGIGAGLRCSEICALNIDDVDLNNGLLLVREGKGRKSRKIYLAEEIIVALQQWIACRGTSDGSLFSKILKNGSITRNAMSSSGLAFTLENLQQLANIPTFTPHDMRRTFITQLLEKGIDLNTVRQLAGHSDVSTTVRYDKRDLDWQRKASQAIVF